MALRTDYVDDELAVSMGGKRQFNIVDSNGNILYENVHIEDNSRYSTIGDNFGADELNEIGEEVNNLSDDLTAITVQSTTPKIVGKDHHGKDIYERVFEGTSLPNQTILDANLTNSNVAWFEVSGCFSDGTRKTAIPFGTGSYIVTLKTENNGLASNVAGVTIDYYFIRVRYVLN